MKKISSRFTLTTARTALCVSSRILIIAGLERGNNKTNIISAVLPVSFFSSQTSYMVFKHYATHDSSPASPIWPKILALVESFRGPSLRALHQSFALLHSLVILLSNLNICSHILFWILSKSIAVARVPVFSFSFWSCVGSNHLLYSYVLHLSAFCRLHIIPWFFVE